MPLIHASPFRPFSSLLTESVDSFLQGTGFSSKHQPKVSPPPEACSCLYAAPCHFPCCSVQALVVLGWKLKQVLKQPHKERTIFNASIFHGVLHNMSSETSACGRWCPRKWKLHSHFHHWRHYLLQVRPWWHLKHYGQTFGCVKPLKWREVRYLSKTLMAATHSRICTHTGANSAHSSGSWQPLSKKYGWSTLI